MNQTLKCLIKNLAPVVLGFLAMCVLIYIFVILPAHNIIPNDAVLNLPINTPVQSTGLGYAPIGLILILACIIFVIWLLASLLKPCFIKVKDETHK